MTTQAKTQRTSGDVAWLIGMAVLVVIGIAAWGIQLNQGMSIIGISQAVAWGIYIATFFTLAGLASGLLILTSLGDLGMIPDIKTYRRGLLLGALASFIASGFMILMDIGQPLRVFNMVFSANLKSPFVWDFGSLVLGVVVTLIYLLSAPKGKVLAAVAGIVGALVLVMEGFILSMSAGATLWQHGGMMPVLFLVEGLTVASAAALIAISDEQVSAWFKRALQVLLPVLVVLNLLEIAAVAYAGHPEAQAATALFWSGDLAPLFWGQALLGILLPFVLLTFLGKNRSLVIAASLLIVLGVFVTKLGVLAAGQELTFMQGASSYTPTWVEAGAVLGIIGLAGLLYALGERLLAREAT